MVGTPTLSDPPGCGHITWRWPPPTIVPAPSTQEAKRSTRIPWGRPGPLTVAPTSHWPWPRQPLTHVGGAAVAVRADPGRVDHVPLSSVTVTPSGLEQPAVQLQVSVQLPVTAEIQKSFDRLKILDRLALQLCAHMPDQYE